MILYLLDTDIVMHLLRRRSPAVECYEAALASDTEFVLSPIVHYEITRYLALKNAARLQRSYDRLISNWVFAELLGEDWDSAAAMWARRHRMGQPIEDSDLLIAVTARKTGAVLVTNNTRHFEGLGLTVENWSLPQAG